MTSELSQRSLLEAAAEGLRKIATDPRCLWAFAAPQSALRDLLAPAARRYIVPDQDEFLARVQELHLKGYRLTAEFAAPDGPGGEPADGGDTVREYLRLLSRNPASDRLGVDLGRLGLAVSRPLAVTNADRIVTAAAALGSSVVLGMGRSPSVDSVLAVHDELAARHENVGVTLQAQLHRTEADVTRLARPGLRVRLVKGAFPEPAGVALVRGPALDERYLRLAQQLVERGARLSLATQDPDLLGLADKHGLLDEADEIEMLHGVQPRLLRTYRSAGHTCRIHISYGANWWLHLLQRLAEHPPMVLSALADIATGPREDEDTDPY